MWCNDEFIFFRFKNKNIFFLWKKKRQKFIFFGPQKKKKVLIKKEIVYSLFGLGGRGPWDPQVPKLRNMLKMCKHSVRLRSVGLLEELKRC